MFDQRVMQGRVHSILMVNYIVENLDHLFFSLPVGTMSVAA
jgi:hypothetical protein